MLLYPVNANNSKYVIILKQKFNKNKTFIYIYNIYKKMHFLKILHLII